MKEFLQEAYRSTKKVAGIDPGKPGNLKPVLLDNSKFAIYKEALSEGLNKKDKASFQLLAENTRMNLLENSMYQLNPYETLTLPVLRVFYPKLIAREAVTVEPMNKPECVKAFLRAEFAPAGASYPNWYPGPVMTPDISGGPSVGTPVTATIDVPTVTPFNVLVTVLGLTSQQAHLERDFEITGVSLDGTAFTDCSIQPAVEGHFSQSVTIGLTSDVISGKVDYLNGTVTCSSTTGSVTAIRYTVTCSLEENRINPKVKLYSDKVRLNAKDREISAEWTIHAEQDMRALFDISMQAEIINVLGQQVALDIDNELINALITANTRLNGATHQAYFDKNPPVEYTWGTKYWHENIIPKLNTLSAVVYTDTNMGSANTILANPLDAAILEDLQTFNYTGTSEVDGDLGYRSATVAGGKWKVLVSSVVPQGTMIVIYKPVEAIKASYIYAPYVPAILTPYPLGPIPSLTILTRYATALVRSKAIAVLNITELN